MIFEERSLKGPNSIRVRNYDGSPIEVWIGSQVVQLSERAAGEIGSTLVTIVNQRRAAKQRAEQQVQEKNA